MVQNMYQRGGLGGTGSPTEFNWSQTGAFQDVSASSLFDAVNLTGDAFPEQTRAMRVSADFFRLSGGAAMHGRTFTAADDQRNSPKTAVLGYAFWLRRFGGDSHVPGMRITLNGGSSVVIGLAGS